MKWNIMKSMVIYSMISIASASLPTEEGLLKNLNNADLPGEHITIKMMIHSLAEPEKQDYIKLQFSEENSGAISLLQSIYSNGQMLNSQIKSVKYIPDLLLQIKREKSQEKSMFYGILMMLATNQSSGVEAFLEKNGVLVTKNKTMLNEDKMRLLRSYRSHLLNSKGKGDSGSPLSPEDPQSKERVLDLFRSNTFKSAKNIELVKKENEFMWKVDWKFAQGYFSNQERQFRIIDYTTSDAQIKVEASQYLLFNGINELPKFINLKDSAGNLYVLQTLSEDVKKVDIKIFESYEELKKLPGVIEYNHSFIL